MKANYFVPILIIDDDSIMRFIHKSLIDLVDLKTTCSEATNGNDALRLIEKSQTLPDLILLDIDMPVMDGFEFAQEFQKLPNSENTKIIVVSSSRNPDDIDKFKKMGINSYASKPLLLPFLELTIFQARMANYKSAA